MAHQEYSAFRSKLSRKPWRRRGETRFFLCNHCGRVFHEFIPEHPHAIDAEVPAPVAPVCCGEQMSVLVPQAAPATLDYDIFGGFNHNAVRARWEGKTPEWILLQAYTSALLKHVPPKKRSPVIFPLADEDAYAYCDQPECVKCQCRCKESCTLYYYFGNGELYYIPLNQVYPDKKR